jgi:iron complex transport system permease protein
MNILIDVDKLEQEGVITSSLASSLRSHAVRETGSTAINVLLAAGAIAIAAGILTLFTSSYAGALFGALFAISGSFISTRHAEQWGKLGSIWLVIGALLLCGSLGLIVNKPLPAALLAAFILSFIGVIAESRLLIMLTPLALGAAIGGSTGYWHAVYMVAIEEPTLDIVLFGTLSIGAWNFSKYLRGARQNLALIFARMCVILVNMGFWVGSLWGDTPGHTWKDGVPHGFMTSAHQTIPSTVFAIGWAIALLLTGAWGAKNGRRFIVNTVAVFGAIHFYTQWFEYLGMHAFSVMLAGVAAVAIGLGLWRYNRKALTLGNS